MDGRWTFLSLFGNCFILWDYIQIVIKSKSTFLKLKLNSGMKFLVNHVLVHFQHIQNANMGNMESRLLIVDDDLSTRRLLTYLLEPHYDVYCAGHGAEAKSWLDAGNQVDLILTDIEMPVMDGIAFIERLEKESKYNHVPIIIISSQNEEDINERIDKLLVDAILKKPIEPKTLFWKIEQVLAQTVIS